MAAPLALIGALKNPRVLAGTLLIALLGLIWFLWHQNGNLNQEIGRLKTGVAEATLVNQRTSEAFQEAKLASDLCNAQWSQITEKNEEIVARFNQTSNALKKQQAQRLRALEKVFNETSCKILGGVSISDACPAAADSLRRSSRRFDGTKG